MKNLIPIILALIMLSGCTSAGKTEESAVTESTTQSYTDSSETEMTNKQDTEASKFVFDKNLPRETKNLISERVIFGEDGAITFHYKYNYDSAGNLIEIKDYCGSNSQTYVYDYNINGTFNNIYCPDTGYHYSLNDVNYYSHPLKINWMREYEEFEGDNCEYDENENVVKVTFYDDNNNPIIYYYNKYDNNGNPTRQKCATTEFFYDGSDRITEYVKTWEYNSDNTLIKNTFLYWDIKETWSYEYDDKGNLVKETFTRDKSDEMNCQLAGTWVTIYEYDKSGNMLKETTIGNGETEIIEYAMIDVIVGVT